MASNDSLITFENAKQLVDALATVISGSRFAIMPEANANNLGKIVQYIGTSGAYTKGYFYMCVAKSGGGYEWQQKDVQPDGGGGGTIDPTPTQDSDNAVASGGVYAALQGKQDSLTFDNAPTQNSNNPVKSGGVYSALQDKQEKIPAGTAGRLVTYSTSQGVFGTPKSIGRGLSDSSDIIGHSNSVTAQTTAALTQIKYDQHGHITGKGNNYDIATAVSSSSTDSQVPTAKAVKTAIDAISIPTVVTSIGATSTDAQVPTAKAVFNYIKLQEVNTQDVEFVLSNTTLIDYVDVSHFLIFNQMIYTQFMLRTAAQIAANTWYRVIGSIKVKGGILGAWWVSIIPGLSHNRNGSTETPTGTGTPYIYMKPEYYYDGTLSAIVGWLYSPTQLSQGQYYMFQGSILLGTNVG